MRRAGLLTILVLALAACGPAAEKPKEKPLDTVDVTDQPDAAANLETDAVARKSSESGVSGALPADFPKDLPLPQPSSLVDFGAGSVTVEVQAPVAEAKSSYFALLKQRGFAAGPGGAWQKGSRRIGVGFADASGATRITIEIH